MFTMVGIWHRLNRKGMPDVRKRTNYRGGLAGAFIAAWFFAGCVNLDEIKLPGIPTAAELNAEYELEEKYRREYQVERSPDAILWLKTHRIKPGMNLQQVNTIFGEDGTRVYEDARYKVRAHYLAGDETYKWGPDSDGNGHLLVFRAGRLVNFDPKEFE